MSNYDLDTVRHSASHIMADAILQLYPGTKFGIGPSIKDGFYYDFELPEGVMLTPNDLPRIEKRMKKIIQINSVFEREEVSKADAIKLMEELGQSYKIEIINELEDETISIYRSGKFIDLCRGPHVNSTKDVKIVKLLSIAGAYWRGDEKNTMLTRVYGTAFLTQEELDNYLFILEEAKKRDHRKLGKELDLFSMNEEVGAGLVIYHPKGALLRTLIEDYLKKEHLKNGYELVIGPHILKSDVWKESGHYDFYKENMFFFEIENQEYGIKPMNCPAHIIVFRSKTRSYKDLPIRYFELGSVYRYEKSGVLHGLLRVRGFTQDDAHIFCLPEHLNEEISKVVEFAIQTMKVFGFEDYQVEISTRPEKSIGTDQDWDRAQNALENALKQMNIAYELQEGEGAFYGPKIDIKLQDALGRSWQCATIQCDFSLPERFNLSYVDQKGQQQRPVMLHRVLLGSIERFMGALIEHHSGNFPLWLAPEQIRVIPVSEKYENYAKEILQELKKNEFRAEIDLRNERMGYKIRNAELERIPYALVVGEKEQTEKRVCVRKRFVKEQSTVALDVFMNTLNEELII